MKTPIRDTLGTVLIAAMVVPYVGYLMDASMPVIHDTLGMAATAFILWIGAFLVADRYDTTTGDGITELLAFAASITLGAAAVLTAGMLPSAAPVLLAAFVVAALATWTVRLLRDSGRWRHGRLVAR